MNRQKELAKNTFIIALGKICTQFVTFFLLPVYTHYLTTAEYGTVDMVVACVSLIAPILSLQLERAAFRFLIDARKKDDEQNEILSTIFTTLIVPILLVVAIVPIARLVFGLAYWQYIMLILITSILSNVALQIPRGLGKNLHFSIGSMIIGVVNALTSIIALVVFHKGVEWVLIGNILSHLAGFIYIFFSMKLYKKIHVSKRRTKTLKEMLKFSIPMIPNDISYWIINISDRMLIFMFLGDSSNGIYAAATKIPAFIVTAYNVFNMSWMETVSAHVHDKDAGEFISKTADMILRLFASVCLGVMAVLPFVFSILVGKDFAEAYDYIPILLIGAFFNVLIGMLSSVYIGYKKTKEIAKTTIVAAILNLTINFALIKTIGIWAAVISTVLAYMFTSFYRLYDINKSVKIKIRPELLCLLTMLLIMGAVMYVKGGMLLNVICLIFAVVAALLLNFNVLKTVFRNVNKLKKGKYERKA